jgi:hypothetical protein
MAGRAGAGSERKNLDSKLKNLRKFTEMKKDSLQELGNF